MSGCKHGGSTDCRECREEAYILAVKYSPASVDAITENNGILQIENINLMQRLSELEAAQRWVPVSERLPPDSKAVLVNCPEYRNMYCANYKYGEWKVFGGSRELINEVAHWMPLPGAPQEAE